MHMLSRKINYITRIAPLVFFALLVAFYAQAQTAENKANAKKTAVGKTAKSKPEAAVEKDSASETATTSALDYLFNRKAKDGSTMAKGGRVADAIGTKAIADEALQGI